MNRGTLENGLLCAALCGADIVAEIQALIGDEPFRDPDRVKYWRILKRRSDAREPFDVDTMMDELSQQKANLQVLIDLQALRFEIGHVPYYCQQIRRLNEMEDARGLGALLLRDAEPDIDEYISRLDELRQTEVATLKTQAEALAAMDERRANPAAVHKTGIKALDEALGGGLLAGQLIVVGGRPGTGKTVLMMQMLLGAVSPAQAGIFVSLEMLAAQMTERLSRRFDRAFIEKLNLHYLDSTNNLGSIAALLKVTARRKKLCGIAIDYLQLLQVTANRHDNREREIARCSQQMKRLALDLEIPVIVGSQLNRESEKRAKPTLADLRESGAIEQDADVVILISPNRNLDEGEGETELIIAKNREHSLKSVSMRLDGAKYRFVETEDKFQEYDRW